MQRKFSSWSEVVDAAKRGARLWYHAPLDRNPVRVQIDRVFKNGKIRIAKPSRDADAFTADAGHLDRFSGDYEVPLTPAERDIAYAWHGGQSSMLYAAASTGALRCGTIRPSEYLGNCQHRPLTDAEWFAGLAWELAAEAEDCAEHESDEHDRALLLSIASKATAAAEAAEKVSK